MELRDKNGFSEREFLAEYRPGDYERPSMAADIVIFTVTDTEPENARRLSEKELCLLLIRRGGHPYLGQWALPGGFVRPTETAEQAAARELREETGVDGVYLEQLYTFTQPGRDPRTWVISCAIERLRGKIEYTDVALHLMPPYFTLTELQQVYEVIWGKELLKAAFRRKIAPLVRETDKFTEDGAHRPSRLYRRNWEESI